LQRKRDFGWQPNEKTCFTTCFCLFFGFSVKKTAFYDNERPNKGILKKSVSLLCKNNVQ
jgi:hypothetical protein